MTNIKTEEPHECDIHVWHGEDWFDALPQLVDPMSGVPYDVTGVVFNLFMRPSLNHTTRFVPVLTSAAEAGIIIDDAAEGLISIFLAQADVEAGLPITRGDSYWEQFLRMQFHDDDLDEDVKKILWTGKLFVHPARDSATP